MEENSETKTLWDYYNKCISDDGAKRAQCTLCKNVYNYSSTVFNLKAHLFKVHKDVIDNEASFIEQRPRVLGKTRVNSMWKSKLWEHFSLAEDEHKVGICNYCQKRVSFRSTTWNLKAHLSRIHPAVGVEAFKKEQDSETSEDETTVPYDDESEDESKLTEVRPFFERETGGRARCLICRDSVPNHHADLRRHLDQHPKLLHEQQDSDVQIQNDDDDDQEAYTEVVYLDDPSPKETPKTETKKWKNETPVKKWRVERNTNTKKSFTKKKQKYRHASTSSDEPVIKKKKGDDEVRKFGEYIICLLEQLPRDLCLKMQMNIVNMIMNANLANTSTDSVPTSAPLVQPVPATVPLVQPVPATVSNIQPVPATLPIVQSQSGTVPVTLQAIPPGYYVLGKNAAGKTLLQNTSAKTVTETSNSEGNHNYSITIAPSPVAITTVAKIKNDNDQQSEIATENGA